MWGSSGCFEVGETAMALTVENVKVDLDRLENF